VTFADGDVAPKTATIPIINDALAEPDETFEVTLSNASGAVLGSVTTAAVTIPSNDQPVPPPANGQPGILQLSAAAYAVDESSGNLIVTIQRIGGTSGAVGATLTISPGTAVAGQDYVGSSSIVAFGSGDAASRIVSIPIVNDTTAEPAESFTVTLSAPTGGATLGAPIAAVASIRDNDPPASPVLTLTPHTKRLDVSWNAVATALTYKVFLNPDGISGFAQVGADVVAPATNVSLDVSVHTFKWPAALLRVEACNDTACTGSVALSTASAMLPAIGYLKAAGVDANDTFGTSVASERRRHDCRRRRAGRGQQRDRHRRQRGQQLDCRFRRRLRVRTRRGRVVAAGLPQSVQHSPGQRLRQGRLDQQATVRRSPSARRTGTRVPARSTCSCAMARAGRSRVPR
jgi:hypothetical protein